MLKLANVKVFDKDIKTANFEQVALSVQVRKL